MKAAACEQNVGERSYKVDELNSLHVLLPTAEVCSTAQMNSVVAAVRVCTAPRQCTSLGMLRHSIVASWLAAATSPLGISPLASAVEGEA